MVALNAFTSAASPHTVRRYRSNRPGRRKQTAGVLVSLLTLAACAAPGAPHDDNGDVILKIADSFSATHPIGRSGTKIFLDILRADGPDVGLQVEYFASGQLGKQSDTPALLRTGVTQIAAVSPAYVGTQLPLSNVGDLPGLTENSCVGANAMRAMMQPGTTLFEHELRQQDVHPLWVAYVSGYEAMSGNFPINSAADLDGKIMRSTGGVADRVVDVAGAAGVSMPIGDLYEAISRGTVEGTLASPVSVTPYKLEEVLHYSTVGAELGGFTATYSISESVWQDLSDQQRAVLTEASDVAQESACIEVQKSVDESKQAMLDAGVQMDLVTDENRRAWDSIAEDVRRNWVDDLTAIDLPAQRILDEATAAFEDAEAQEAGETK